MNCTDITNSLDDWLDGDLPAGQVSDIESHAAACPSCRERLNRERALLERLRRLPAPEPDDMLFDRALATAIKQDHRHRLRRWFGVGGALAASLILVIGLTIQLQPEFHPGISDLSVSLLNEHEISLVVESPLGLDNATFNVVLPPGIELTGFPEQREITWVGRLEPGKNLLALPVRIQAGYSGNIVTQIRHAGKQKTFTISMDAPAAPAELSAVLPPAAPALPRP